MTLHRFWGAALGLMVLISVLLPLGPANRGWLPAIDPTAAPARSSLALTRPALLRPALAGPVDWREVEATPEGRQWWDAGSLRRDRRGQLSVLSRFQPAAPPPESASAASPPPTVATRAAAAPPSIASPPAPASAAPAGPTTPAQATISAAAPPAGSQARPEPRPQPGTLYVMELDCEQELYRDISINGIPRWGAPWQAAAGDSLTIATLRAACAAAPPPHA